jgi:hypothetical protein
MTYLRHANGGGKKFDEAEADPGTFLSRSSSISGESDLFEAVVDNTEEDKIVDSFIHQAQIINSSVLSTIVAGKVRVENCLVACKSITGHVRATNSILQGETRLFGSAESHNSAFQNLSVGGTAKIVDWNKLFKTNGTGPHIFDGQFGRITSGTWTRPPRIIRFEDLEVTVTESTEGRAFVGCIEKPMKRWIQGGHSYGAARGWSPEQVDRLADIFKEWLLASQIRY